MKNQIQPVSFHVPAPALFGLALSAILFIALMLPDHLFAQTDATTRATSSTTMNPPTITTSVASQTQSEEILLRQLKLGDSGSDVSLLQLFLAEDPNVYPEGLVTGYFGQLTRDAVKRFQTTNGLPAVGRMGPQTLSLINMHLTSGTAVGGNTSITTPDVPNTGTLGVGDRMAPVILTVESSLVTRDTASVSWTTNEPTRGHIFYGNKWPYIVLHNPIAIADQYTMQHQTMISGLIPGERYYYKIAVTDAAGNTTINTIPYTLDTLP